MFIYSPYESDFILVTQVRATICCLLILFITQSGSTRRPPCLLLCCFPLHRRQISSDITSSALSSTATKTQTSKGLAWRLNKSACHSANQCDSLYTHIGGLQDQTCLLFRICWKTAHQPSNCSVSRSSTKNYFVWFGISMSTHSIVKQTRRSHFIFTACAYML